MVKVLAIGGGGGGRVMISKLLTMHYLYNLYVMFNHIFSTMAEEAVDFYTREQ